MGIMIALEQLNKKIKSLYQFPSTVNNTFKPTTNQPTEGTIDIITLFAI